MKELPRFDAAQDTRPVDAAWPSASWPVLADTVLRGNFVEVRPSVAADSAELFEALDHDQVWTHVAGRPVNTAEMAALIAWKSGEVTWQPWTIRLAQPVAGLPAGAIVGTSSYLETFTADARTEIGSTLYTPAVWGTVVNPETKLLLLEFAFETLAMGRVQIKTDVRNERSQLAIARLGAQFEGLLHRYQRRADGTVRDTALFSIVAEGWPEVRTRLAARLPGE